MRDIPFFPSFVKYIFSLLPYFFLLSQFEGPLSVFADLFYFHMSHNNVFHVNGFSHIWNYSAVTGLPLMSY